MIIPINLAENSYKITLERGALLRAGEIFDLDRHALVVTDSGVPKKYAEAVAKCAKKADIVVIEQGEKSKSFDTLRTLLRALTENGYTRTDCVDAVGGGVAGDMIGMGVGMAAAGAIGSQFTEMFKGFGTMPGSEPAPAEKVICPNCQKEVPANAKFCLEF